MKDDLSSESHLTVDENKEYQQHYQEEKFWDKLTQFAFKIGSKGVYYALLLYYVMIDPDTPFAHKAIIGGALGYLILPIDLIPDLMPGVGYGDDIGILYKALQTIKTSINDSHRKQAQSKFQSWFPKTAPPHE